ncbi:cystatin-8 [Arapaima gigas]
MASLGIFLFLCLLSAAQLSRSQQPGDVDLIKAEHVQPLGGWSSVNSQNPEVHKAANKAVEEFNSRSKTKKLFQLVEVTSATSQVMNIILYKINATIGKTNCLKSEAIDKRSCVLRKKYLACEFEVALDPRNNTFEVISSVCRKQPQK